MAKDPAKKTWALSFVLILTIFLTACHVHDDDVDDCRYCHSGGGDVEGIAYFPYESGYGEYPVYYETGNADIHVTLYDMHGDIVGHDVTGDDGFYLFTDAPPGTYYVNAYIELYNPDKRAYDIFEADSYDFYVDHDEIVIVDLYLEYTGHSRASAPLEIVSNGLAGFHPDGALIWRNQLQPSA